MLQPPKFRSIAFCAVLLSITAAAFPQARVSLSGAAGTLTQTSNTPWTLAETGVTNPVSSTVTWTITATPGTVVSGHLQFDGYLTIANAGNEPATIGNIVVNLQTKPKSTWTTQSSDVADATNGDKATTAKVDPNASCEHRASFTENTASGALQFMDAHTNTLFSLVPEVTIAPKTNVNLLFTAAFDNTVLKLATGTAVRAEIIVSFGNAAPHAQSAPQIDINGNGVIDADEAWVSSVEILLSGAVPKQVAANTAPSLTDAASNIATVGTITISNPQFTLGNL